MGRSERLIILEFNELSPTLMNQFIDAGFLPNFKVLRDTSNCFVTDAGEEPPNLEPWIQWVTVHTGQPFSAHKIFHLGDAASIKLDSIWDWAAQRDWPVWVCGSMNAVSKQRGLGWFLPDPWSVGVRPSPAELDPYFDFVRSQVMEYTRKDTFSYKAAWRFMRFMVSHGIRARTIGRIFWQLVAERFSDVHWRRATILDALQFDLFLHGYANLRPKLSTFFLNSTAHFQHVYWRNMDPASFKVKPSAAEQRTYQNAVRYGYQNMDRMVGEVLKLAGDNTAIALVTGLSQQPCVKYEERGGKRFYKVIDYNRLLSCCDVDPTCCSVEPVMSEQFHLRFASEEQATAAATRLRALKFDGVEVLGMRLDGNSIMAGCAVFRALDQDARLDAPFGKQRFADLFYLVDLTKSGMHHPDGIFWLRSTLKEHAKHPGRLPLVEVAPALAGVLGLSPNNMSTVC